MDKELALAIDFKKAPKELQDLATAHYDNMKALNKAHAKLNEDTLALAASQKKYDESGKALRVALKAWEPVV